ncbi:hypothetical protein KFL_000450410 [Klebsormidium nitens]|uniref:GDP-fucose protein O-fucosyltransferase 2 n=1 Tax=Klebsormidium nitens TaxID=105231 RepID=A0A1Y1HN71_KLENI|nr:hypothetical protein KFL_000450410 [Klebsormidium nitens]|eukprot:GAQ80084.1 hypothetical protein KFL_000450410 [Klebsormidium nitens]
MRSDKYIIAADINEQLTKASRHFAELLALALELKRTIVLPDSGEGEFGMQRPAPFCQYFDSEKLGEYVDWVTLEQFVYETRKRQGAEIEKEDATRAVAEMRRTAFFLAFNETHPVTNYPDYFEGLANEEWKQLGAGRKPSGAALVLRRREDFCGMRVRPWLWYRMSQLADVDRVVCVDEPKYDGIDEKEAFRRVVDEVRALKDPDVLFVVKSRAFDAFAPKELIEKGLEYLEVTPKVPQHAAKLKQWLGGPYIALQWRVEKCIEREDCDMDLLLRCAQGAVTAARAKLRELNLSRVFFATDVPTASGEMRSHSYRQHGPARIQQASDAAAYIEQRIDTFTWEDFDGTVTKIDSALQGALDTALCLDAAAFLTAPQECVGTYSWYVSNIRSQREKAGKGEQAMMTWTVPKTLEPDQNGEKVPVLVTEVRSETGKPLVWAAGAATGGSWLLLTWYLFRRRSISEKALSQR